jgi:glutathione S-transferase
MLKVLGRASSSNVQKVIWLLTELQVPHVRDDYGGRFGGNKTADYLALNPNGLVPTLLEDDFVLWESNSICRYLANKFAAERLYPSPVQVRASCERWMDWQLSTLAPAIGPLYVARVRSSGVPLDQATLTAMHGRSRAALAVLDAGLRSSAFLVGEDLTLADMGVGIWTHRWFALGGSGEGLEHLSRWYLRLKDRAPFRQTVLDIAFE